MNSNQTNLRLAEQQIIERLHALEPTRRRRILRNLITTALGSIPWVGTLVTAVLASRDESTQSKIDSLQFQWLQEHSRRMEKLACDLAALTARLDQALKTGGEDQRPKTKDQGLEVRTAECPGPRAKGKVKITVGGQRSEAVDGLDERIAERLESESYLALVRKAFRLWDQSDTDLKRQYIGKLLVNAAATKLCDDDMVRLFLDWLDSYHESHFKVVREIFQNPGSTRFKIWERLHGEFPPDNSSEADLFRMLVGDLSQGRIIRQQRTVNDQGQFLKKSRGRHRSSRTQPAQPTNGDGSVIVSAFDDTEPYELTELGKQFVRYVFSGNQQKETKGTKNEVMKTEASPLN